MPLTQTYEETHGIQANWPDTQEAKPYKIKPKFFIDVESETVASADTFPEIQELLANYPAGVVRYWEPSQEEYSEELRESLELLKNNFGIMTPK